MQQQSPQKQSKKEIDCSDENTNEQTKTCLAPEPKKEEPKNEVKQSKNTILREPWITTEKLVLLIILLIAIPASIIYINSDYIPTATYAAEQFDFQVFCPIYYDMHYQLKAQRGKTFVGFAMQHFFRLADQVSIYSQLHGKEQKRIYVVKVLDGQNQTNSTQYGMRYCGLARSRLGTCEKNSKLICTTPGPIFETIKDQEIIVIWVNGIQKLQQKHQPYISKNLSSCYEIYANQLARPRFCTLRSKLPEFRSLAYEDPTILPPQNQYQNYTISHISTPISPYVHAMVGRPSFNGGPLSWFTSRGQVGLGYSTAQKQNIDLMKSVIRRNLKLNQVLMKRYRINQFNYKIDIYQNRQLPAILMYYDSAISVAKKNLMSGLSGLYIIRDPEIQKILPNPSYQHQIIIHPSVARAREYSKPADATKNEIKPIARASSQDQVIFRNAVYRLRIVNADFLKIYHKLKFVGTDSGHEEVIVDFYIVGTDSSLRNKPYGPVSEIDSIAPAERYDILIKFNQSLNQIVNLVHGQDNQLVTRIHLSQKSVSEENIPKQIPQIPYLNYSLFDDRVVRRRMRPFAKTSDDHIATNGHLTIFQGKSEDPMLGSVQDWYFINNVDVPHSIHLDLAQFQIIDQFTLNQVPNTHSCTFYNVDFFMKFASTCRKDIKIGNKTYKPEEYKNFVGQTLQEYQDVCKFMEKLNKTEYTQCFEQFANEEDNEGSKHLSGIDVEQICKNEDKSAPCMYRYKTEDEKEQGYKYRGQEITIPEYRKGYKDVLIVPKIAFTRIRIRWARLDFPQKMKKQKERDSELFFYASEEQLSQYPGFTYRSTLVRDEQSHMIRPIMVQPHPEGKSKSWKQIYSKLNAKQFENHRNRIYTSWHEDDNGL